MKTDRAETDVQRRLVQGWAQAGKLLDELRRARLSHQSPEESRRAAYDMLQLGGMLPSDSARARMSGLVEMQRLFARLRRRDLR
jgi:hypothetical protein